MSISARAAPIRDMPESDRPLSEEWRVVSKQWVDADAAANLLEETKSAVLSRLMMAEGDMPVSKAEMRVKASEAWADHISRMVDARAKANLLKVRMEWVKLKHSEWLNGAANARAERRM